MKRTITLAVVAFVAMMVMGCTQLTDPEPVKVYLTGSDTFISVHATNYIFKTLAITSIYQWDGEGTYYTGDNVEVSLYKNGGTTETFNWTITVGGDVYINTANVDLNDTDGIDSPLWASTGTILTFIFGKSSGVIVTSTDPEMNVEEFTYTCPSDVNTITNGTYTWTR